MVFVLAEAKDWLSIWQLPVVLILVGVWILLGGRFLWKQVASQASRKEAGQDRCRIVALLCGIIGVFCAGIAIVLGKMLGDAMSVRWFWVSLPLGALAFIGASFLTVFASFQIPAGKLVRVWVKSFGPVLIIATIAMAPTFWISYSANQKIIDQAESCRDFYDIFRALSSRRYQSYAPKSLAELKDLKGFKDGSLRSRRHPGREIGYFYFSSPLAEMDEKTTRLLACDWLDNQAGGVRVVLFANGQIKKVTEQRFKSLLREEDNMVFASALAEAEKKLSSSK